VSTGKISNRESFLATNFATNVIADYYTVTDTYNPTDFKAIMRPFFATANTTIFTAQYVSDNRSFCATYKSA
jgi:hypothetical protein